MKTRMILAALLLVAFGTVKAQNEADQINIIRVLGSGDVYVSQTPGQLSLKKDGRFVTDYNRTSDMLILSGSDDYEVTISQLKNIQLSSAFLRFSLIMLLKFSMLFSPFNIELLKY